VAASLYRRTPKNTPKGETLMAEMTIRRFSVFSVAKIQGLLGFVIGLIIGVIYGLILMLAGALMSSLAPGGDSQVLGGVSSVVGGLIAMVVFPVIYGVLGFFGGAIGAVIYNLAAGVIGGIRFELEGVTPPYAPPPPEQWRANAA
jgi:MFS family permease